MMTNERPAVTPSGLYTVGQTCEALGIHRNTLARYEKRGLIRSHMRRATMRRVFKGSDILNMWERVY